MSAVRMESTTGGERRVRAVLGTVLLLFAASLTALIFVEATTGVPFEMPRSWYFAPAIWYLLAFAALIIGCGLVWKRPAETSWAPMQPGKRFQRVVVYTRAACGLCDEAEAMLQQYATWLPEIETVDVDADPALVERFGTRVPVVEIDGRTRFEGRVNEVLLRRLIEGTPPGQSSRGFEP